MQYIYVTFIAMLDGLISKTCLAMCHTHCLIRITELGSKTCNVSTSVHFQAAKYIYAQGKGKKGRNWWNGQPCTAKKKTTALHSEMTTGIAPALPLYIACLCSITSLSYISACKTMQECHLLPPPIQEPTQTFNDNTLKTSYAQSRDNLTYLMWACL